MARTLHPCRHTAALVCIALAGVMGACASSGDQTPRTGGDPRGPVVRREARSTQRSSNADGPGALPRDTIERIDAPAGSAFVVPIDPALLRDPARPVRLLLDDGLELPATLFRVSVAPVPTNPADPWDSWLPPATSWTSAPITPREAAAIIASPEGDRTGFALLVEPKGGRADNAVWLGEERVPMQWLPSIETLALATPSITDGSWTVPFPAEVLVQSHITSAIAREASGPMTRWRALLLGHGLRPDAPTSPFADPLIEALASQREHRVRVALARLWATQPDLCERVKRRLTAVVPVAPGVHAPVWETDASVVDRLLLDLLNSAFTPERRAQLAEQWLSEQPQAAAWVRDEGAAPGEAGDASPATSATVTIVNLSMQPTTAWLALPREGTPAEMTPLAPLSAAALSRVLPERQRTNPPGLIARAGDWSRAVGLLPVRIPASPPGVSTGLFAPGPTMQEFIIGGSAGIDADWATAVLLYRPASPVADATAPEYRRWELWVECRVPVGDIDRSRGRLMVYTGPMGAPSAAWSIAHDGAITSLREADALLAQELGPEVARAQVTDLVDRWTARVPLPAGSLEDGHLLRLGLVREDGTGARSAWPRPMLPWQTEPARACIDLSAWGQ